MEHVLEMGTTARHNKLLSGLQYSILNTLENLYKAGQIESLLEQVALCHTESRLEWEWAELIDLNRECANINNYNVIYPDYMLFKDQPYKTNEEKTRYAGRPDLLVEVWSDGNDNKLKIFKKTIYSSSPVTEHWYIEQNSNSVECWLGKTQLPEQSLKAILKTQSGLEIDLRHMAL